MTFRSDATEGVWSPTQNVAVQIGGVTQARAQKTERLFETFFDSLGLFSTFHLAGCSKRGLQYFWIGFEVACRYNGELMGPLRSGHKFWSYRCSISVLMPKK